MEHRAVLPALVTIFALLVYFWNVITCGRARGRNGVIAPATTGCPEFERAFRIQQNMVEQLILFIPSVFIFSLTIQPLAGAALGLAFVIGRIVYSVSYAKDPAKRGPGFGLGMLSVSILLLGSLAGIIRVLAIDL